MEKITEEKANKIYDILVSLGGANESERDNFIYYHIESFYGCDEWRFGGKLGFGGKYRSITNRVDCYQEDEDVERIKLIEEIDSALLKIDIIIPTIEEYKKAKEITFSYEKEQIRLFNLKVEAFKIDLTDYFKNNLIDGVIQLKEFELKGDSCGEIIPIEPDLMEEYEGGNNEDIKQLCEKHGVNFRFAFWCYPK